jgi:ribose transport system permease protein
VEGGGEAAGQPSGATVPWRARVAGVSLTELAERFGLAGLFGLLVLVFSILRPDTFATGANWSSIATTDAVTAVLALAMLPPLITGRFDVSAGANMTLSAIFSAALMSSHGWSLGPAILAALVVGTFVGTFNGVMVAYCGVNSIIGTLGTATIIGGLVTAYTSGVPISEHLSTTLTDLSIDKWLGLPTLFILMLIMSVIVWFMLTQTPFGRYLEAVGTNLNAARLTGLRVTRMVFLSFVIGGLFAGVAGVLLVGTEGTADPSSASISTIVPALAAAFLGATTWRPGHYNVPGTLIALFFLGALTSGLALVGAQPWVTDAMNGAVVIVAVGIGVQIKRRRTGTVEIGE